MAEPLASHAPATDYGDTSVVGQAIYCSCGAPGRIDYAWNGDGYVVCDGYTPCGRDLESVSFGSLQQLHEEIEDSESRRLVYLHQGDDAEAKLTGLRVLEEKLEEMIATAGSTLGLADTVAVLEAKAAEVRADIADAEGDLKDAEEGERACQREIEEASNRATWLMASPVTYRRPGHPA